MSSKQQPTVSDSTTEAEYKALSDGAKEAVYIRRLFVELGLAPTRPIPLTIDNTQVHTDLLNADTPTHLDVHLQCDNQGGSETCGETCKNSIFHAKTKHIEGKYHFIRERVLEGEISVNYIPTQDLADMFTKQLARPKFEQHHAFIGVTSTTIN